MPRIFINPRGEDASGHAGRLYDALAGRFGREQVFMDVDAIRPGENFATVLDDSVASCDVDRLLRHLDAPGSPGGLTVPAGGPHFALTRRLASTVTASLTPADS